MKNFGIISIVGSFTLPEPHQPPTYLHFSSPRVRMGVGHSFAPIRTISGDIFMIGLVHRGLQSWQVESTRFLFDTGTNKLQLKYGQLHQCDRFAHQAQNISF